MEVQELQIQQVGVIFKGRDLEMTTVGGLVKTVASSGPDAGMNISVSTVMDLAMEYSTAKGKVKEGVVTMIADMIDIMTIGGIKHHLIGVEINRTSSTMKEQNLFNNLLCFLMIFIFCILYK